MSKINISKQSEKMTCNICCDSENISNTLCNCSGEICVKCINNIITLKGIDNNPINNTNLEVNNSYILEYICPFCKKNNHNVFDHIKSLKNNEFNKIISDKIDIYNKDYRLNTDNQIIDLEDNIYELETNIENLEKVIQKDKQYLSFVEEKYESTQYIAMQKEDENNKLSEENKKLKLIIDNLQNKTESETKINESVTEITNNISDIIIKNTYHCNICNKTINKNSKYSHLKSQKHLKLCN